jgi:hypothetical protein
MSARAEQGGDSNELKEKELRSDGCFMMYFPYLTRFAASHYGKDKSAAVCKSVTIVVVYKADLNQGSYIKRLY